MSLGRSLLASALACVVLAGAAPFGLAADAGGCPMPCCRGAGGDCADGSCPVAELYQPEAPPPAAEPEESDPVCGADAAAHGTQGTARAARPPKPKPAAPAVRVEHEHRRHVSARNTRPGVPSVAAFVSKPCPPDCGAAANSYTNPRPSRQHAALAPKARPRPPTPAACERASAFSNRTSSARRGPSSPRAPPADAPTA